MWCIVMSGICALYDGWECDGGLCVTWYCGERLYDGCLCDEECVTVDNVEIGHATSDKVMRSYLCSYTVRSVANWHVTVDKAMSTCVTVGNVASFYMTVGYIASRHVANHKVARRYVADGNVSSKHLANRNAAS